MSEVKTAAAPAKVQDTKTAAQKMPAISAAINETAKPTPAPFTDPDQFKESIQPPPPISERLEKLELLNKLCEQRDEVTEALEKLRQFEQSPNGGQSIIFRGADGDSTATKHPAVIEAMVQVATSRLKSKLQEIEMQILL